MSRADSIQRGLAACEERGRQAALNGSARSENPYTRSGSNAARWWKSWDDGWLRGEAERGQVAA